MDQKVLAAIAACKEGTATAEQLSTYNRRRAALDRIAERAADAIDLGSISDLLFFCHAALSGHMEPGADDPGDDLDKNEVAAALANKIDLDAIEGAADVARSTALDIRYGQLTRRASA